MSDRPNAYSNEASNAQIFVSIACFSDPDVVATVADALKQAENAARIHFGICLQVDPKDTEYADLANFPHVRLDKISLDRTRGPIYARSRCEALLQDETYFLQIDCHTRFFPDWDSKLIRELHKAEQVSPKAVISHYPINIVNMNVAEKCALIGQVNRFRQIDDEGIKSHGSLVRMPATPLASIAISAANLFMRSEVRKAIPYDPFLNFGLHAAEQVLYAVRLWTHGYDIYCPTLHTTAHCYDGSRDRISEHAKEIMKISRSRWPKATWSKVKYLLGLDTKENIALVYKHQFVDNNFEYDLGTERSLLDYYRFANIHDTLKGVYPNYRFKDM